MIVVLRHFLRNFDQNKVFMHYFQGFHNSKFVQLLLLGPKMNVFYSEAIQALEDLLSLIKKSIFKLING